MQYVYVQLRRIAMKHDCFEAATRDLASQLPFEERVSFETASNVLKNLVSIFTC